MVRGGPACQSDALIQSHGHLRSQHVFALSSGAEANCGRSELGQKPTSVGYRVRSASPSRTDIFKWICAIRKPKCLALRIPIHW
jgi:hypothetical protein